MQYFKINGHKPLKGEVTIPGSKNAALPMLCGALLTPETCVFHNVPDITDIAILLSIFSDLGAEVSRDIASKTVTITAKNIDPSKLGSIEQTKKFRASILMLGPLLARFGEACILQPGGCVIGARPNFIHIDGFTTLGCTDLSQEGTLHLKRTTKTHENNRLLLSEASVTGTENIALYLAGMDDEAEVFFTAAEPHVQATLKMLVQMGAQISGIGTHHLTIKGTSHLKGGDFTLPPDGIQVGTYAVAGIITQGDILIKNVDHAELYSFYGPLKRMGANFAMEDNALHIKGPQKLTAIPKLQTAIYPGVSTDLQSVIGVMLTQCEGDTVIFETLFEQRLSYLEELQKMGAKVQYLNPHQAIVSGKTPLKGAQVQSWDLRAGAAVVLAGLIAQGETEVTNINYIDRGYENFEANLRSLGANIVRVTS